MAKLTKIDIADIIIFLIFFIVIFFYIVQSAPIYIEVKQKRIECEEQYGKDQCVMKFVPREQKVFPIKPKQSKLHIDLPKKLKFKGIHITDNISYRNIQCIAANIYHEARGESIDGQLAVANVVMNRVHSNKFPNTPCDVVKQKIKIRGKTICQFSWYCDGKKDVIDIDKTYKVNYDYARIAKFQIIALLVNTGIIKDNTDGALYYHANYVNPKWATKFTMVAAIDNQKFYRY